MFAIVLEFGCYQGISPMVGFRHNIGTVFRQAITSFADSNRYSVVVSGLQVFKCQLVTQWFLYG